MVRALKKWLGIEALERENLRLAKSLISAHQKIEDYKKSHTNLRIAQADYGTRIAALEKGLTTEPVRPKIVPKSNRVNWANFRTAAETASEREEA